MRPLRFVLPLAALALCAPSLGCSKIKDKITEKALEKAGIQKGDDDKTFTVKQGGLTFGNSQKVPDGFPPEVPIYPGAKVMASATSSQGKGPAYSVTLTTNDPVDSVVSFYNAKAAAGTQTFAMGNMLSYATDKHQITVMVNENAGASPSNELGSTVLVLTVDAVAPKTSTN